MAGLPASRAWVGVKPPLSPSGARSGSVPFRSFEPPRLQLVSLLMLSPAEIGARGYVFDSEDLDAVPALLVLIGAPRLRRIGLDVPDTEDFPEDRLYAQLASVYGDGGTFWTWLAR